MTTPYFEGRDPTFRGGSRSGAYRDEPVQLPSGAWWVRRERNLPAPPRVAADATRMQDVEALIEAIRGARRRRMQEDLPPAEADRSDPWLD